MRPTSPSRSATSKVKIPDFRNSSEPGQKLVRTWSETRDVDVDPPPTPPPSPRGWISHRWGARSPGRDVLGPNRERRKDNFDVVSFDTRYNTFWWSRYVRGGTGRRVGQNLDFKGDSTQAEFAAVCRSERVPRGKTPSCGDWTPCVGRAGHRVVYQGFQPVSNFDDAFAERGAVCPAPVARLRLRLRLASFGYILITYALFCSHCASDGVCQAPNCGVAACVLGCHIGPGRLHGHE